MWRSAIAALALLLPPLVAQNDAHQFEIVLRALDETGKPIEGAGISINASPTVAEALKKPVAKTDGEGWLRHRVTIPPDQSVGMMLLSADSRCSYHRLLWAEPFPLLASHENKVDLGDIRLPRGHTLTGRIRDDDGKPIVGATVTATDQLSTASMYAALSSRTTTDERGFFVLRGTPGRGVELEVIADGFYTQLMPTVLPGTPLDLTLQPSGFVSGTARHADGSAFRGYAIVHSEFFKMFGGYFPLQDGAFRIGIERPGRYRVSITDLGHQVVGESALLVGANEDVAIEVAMPTDKECFRVRAIDKDTQQPIKNIRASTSWSSNRLEPWVRNMLEGSMRRAGDDGAVRLQIEQEGPTLAVLADGWAPHVEFGVDNGADKEHVVELRRGGTIAGQLLAADGKPIAGASVTCTKSDRHWPCSAVTAADGTFVLTNVIPGNCTVKASHPAGTVATEQRVKVKPGGRAEGVELRLPKGASIRGRFVGKAQPGRSWRVVLGPANATPPQDVGYATSEVVLPEAAVVGRTFELPARKRESAELYVIVPMPPRKGPEQWIRLQSVKIGKDDQDLEIDLEPFLPGNVYGNVTTLGANLPLERIAILATPEDRGLSHLTTRFCLVDADGTYTLPAGPGKYSLQAIDTETGVVLYEHQQDVTVRADARTVCDVTFPLATVHARFDTDAPHVPVQSIAVRQPDVHNHRIIATLFGGSRFGVPGCDLSGHNRPMTFFLPPGTHELVMRPGATTVSRGVLSYTTGSESSIAVTISEGQTHTETLKTPDPQNIRTK